MDKFIESIINKDYMAAEKEFKNSILEKVQDRIEDMKQEISESFLTEAKVVSKSYSWGKMKTIHQDKDFSIPLHPEHQEAISKLKDGESHMFRDETKAKWTATRDGDTVNFKGGSREHPFGSYKTSAKFQDLTEAKKKFVMDERDDNNNGVDDDKEQLDEISKDTLKSYVKGAVEDIPSRVYKSEMHMRMANDIDSSEHRKSHSRIASKNLRKVHNRTQGISKALDKLTKE